MWSVGRWPFPFEGRRSGAGKEGCSVNGGPVWGQPYKRRSSPWKCLHTKAVLEETGLQVFSEKNHKEISIFYKAFSMQVFGDI